MRWLLRLVPMLCLLLAGCASSKPAGNALQEAEDAWSSAIRWGNFDGAVNLIDPALRARLAPNGIESARFKQLQISAYRDVGSSADTVAGTAVRDVEIGVINRKTQAERTLRHRETWRYDAAAHAWWNTSGLPDLGPGS